MKRKRKIWFCMICLVAVLSGCGLTVNEACEKCGESPSVLYSFDDGSTAYICKDCSRDCAFCAEKATTAYKNTYGQVIFVCKDCYEDVLSISQ